MMNLRQEQDWRRQAYPEPWEMVNLFPWVCSPLARTQPCRLQSSPGCCLPASPLEHSTPVMFAIPIPTVLAIPSILSVADEAELPEQPQPEQALWGQWL